MRENDFYDVMVREMTMVKDGDKSPEKAAMTVMEQFSKENIYISTRFLKHADLASKVLHFRNSGLTNGAIAERLGISTRHVRRLYSSIRN